MIGSPPKQENSITSFDLYFAIIIVSIAYGDILIDIKYTYMKYIYIYIYYIFIYRHLYIVFYTA